MPPDHAEHVSKFYSNAPIEYIDIEDKKLEVQNFSHITKLAFIDVTKWHQIDNSETSEVV